MSSFFNTFILIIAISLGLAGYFVLRDGELPQISDQYWGSGSAPTSEDKSIRPFQINISEKVLTDLRTRLSLEVASQDERVADNLEGVGFEYGMNKKFLKKVVTHWLNQYDWKQREKMLNKYPSFKTKISGIDIHFQHVKPSTKGKRGNLPLLLIHGWPASFTEYQKLIPLLVDAKDSEYNFELVIVSLPGSGFSEASRKPGLGPAEMSPIFLTLMKRLGHEKFYVQGGDWGSLIASNMGTLYRDNVLGIHMTMCFSNHPRSILKFGLASVVPQLFMDDDEIIQHVPLYRFLFHLLRETGYFHLQATKPDTIGVALSHSPSGYAAYFLEKYSFWTNATWLHLDDGGISSRFNLDELLDSLMVHWVGQSITTGMRIYREIFNVLTSNQFALDRVPVHVPASCLNFPNELLAMPKFPLLEKYPHLRYSKAPTGGHFNALEVPDIVAKDIRTSFSLVEIERTKLREPKK
ncbi:juvenile hormone epoxide hydrolase 1 [Folsomia candida]|uniref:Epoxide hydrolase n=1 Tax=Folsomia candida TaxID=158441 RepID=A0A226EL50_FOLCA|nr:juvenile hormone epoxide hydrolase 1 [Folsomia candida]OXA58423.1 Juvenile hormone epoxide hydrolase 1 [Folsomia candida]